MSENRNPSNNAGATNLPVHASRKLAPTTAIDLCEEPENNDLLGQMRLLLRLLLENALVTQPELEYEVRLLVMERLQRYLTKNLFMHNNCRVLVTFSAGVALHGANEEVDEIIGRADKAMYKAKKGGKNRVEAAE